MLFGTSAPLIGSYSHGTSPVLVASLLFAGAALVLLPLAMAEAPTSRHAPIQRQDLPLLGLITLLGSTLGSSLLLAAPALAVSTVLPLRSSHGHWHRHAELDHQHRDFHAPVDGDAYRFHPHRPEDLADLKPDQPFRHSHRHRHVPLAHEHPHVSDVHHPHEH